MLPSPRDGLKSRLGPQDGERIETQQPLPALFVFFHERDARTVYLCYLLGEEQLSFWHELDAGFAGRQKL